MKILILGGTVFLGRHFVEAALQQGHEVTIFTRGIHNADLYPEVEKLVGNRDGNLQVLTGRRFDAAIDTSGFVPRIVRDSARQLANAVDHYTFISSISVYGDFSQHGLDENAAVGKLEDETTEDVSAAYGELKALCEQAAEKEMPGRVLNVRPGLIVGPYDKTDRFTYWPTRVANGGHVLAPGNPHRQIQVIDARDLAEWTLRMVEAKQTGVYNATGPDYRLTMGDLLKTCQEVSNSDAVLHWVTDDFLTAHEVGEWAEMPLWLREDNLVGMLSTNVHKAISSGLTFRPLQKTVRDTLVWDQQRDATMERKAGLQTEKEARVLAAWMAAQANA